MVERVKEPELSDQFRSLIGDRVAAEQTDSAPDGTPYQQIMSNWCLSIYEAEANFITRLGETLGNDALPENILWRRKPHVNYWYDDDFGVDKYAIEAWGVRYTAPEPPKPNIQVVDLGEVRKQREQGGAMYAQTILEEWMKKECPAKFQAFAICIMERTPEGTIRSHTKITGNTTDDALAMQHLAFLRFMEFQNS